MMNRVKGHDVILEFEIESILYDLKNLGYIITDSSPKQDAADGHNLVDIAEEGNKDRVTRALDLAYANVLRFLAGYVKQPLNEDTFAHNALGESDYYLVCLSLKSVPQTTVSMLKTYIHEYFIDFAMEDWTSIVSPEIEPVWAKKLEDMESSIKGCLGYRKGGVQIKVHPWP